MARYGSMGKRLSELAMGEDNRRISADSAMKSISSETTFNEDIGDEALLDAHIYRLAVKVADRAKAKEIAGRTVTLKLKTPDFKTVTRQQALDAQTQLADAIYRISRDLLTLVIDKAPFRLIGVGIGDLSPADGTDAAGDLFDPQAGKRAAAERATDRIRAKFGDGAVVKGRHLG